MSKDRLEAFSDGVIAILITILVLELKIPQGTDWTALRPLLPVFLTYVLSFIFLAIYWNNHHHMLQATERINGKILWANTHLLFWLSLVPFVTGWMGENHFAAIPTAAYGVVLLGAAVAYTILLRAILAEQSSDSPLAIAVGNDRKGKISLLLYSAAIPLAFVHQAFADAIYVVVALIWLVPDRRIEERYARRIRKNLPSSMPESPRPIRGRGMPDELFVFGSPHRTDACPEERLTSNTAATETLNSAWNRLKSPAQCPIEKSYATQCPRPSMAAATGAARIAAGTRCESFQKVRSHTIPTVSPRTSVTTA
jgi:uncharacterized membrane protein